MNEALTRDAQAGHRRRSAFRIGGLHLRPLEQRRHPSVDSRAPDQGAASFG
jgi:hypothetical protein